MTGGEAIVKAKRCADRRQTPCDRAQCDGHLYAPHGCREHCRLYIQTFNYGAQADAAADRVADQEIGFGQVERLHMFKNRRHVLLIVAELAHMAYGPVR